MGKGDRKNRSRQRHKQAVQTAQAVEQAPPQATDGKAVRPTPQRLARGQWVKPHGMGKHDRPFVDVEADMIGQLLEARKITKGQEQAARQWQHLRELYIAELPDVALFKSCLHGGVPGFDDGDGNPQIIAEYRQIERRMNRAQRVEVLRVCEDNQRPGNMAVLCAALDVIGGC